VKGKYVSVERFRELESESEDGRGGYALEWRMATCSTPGGLIPTWISERSIPGEIMKVCFPPSSQRFCWQRAVMHLHDLDLDYEWLNYVLFRMSQPS